MANSAPISKIKIDNETYNIKDIISREQKLDKNNAVGSGFIAFNASGISQGVNGVSLGYRNAAAGNSSVALGSENNAAANFSTAIGKGVVTNSPNQINLGKFNLPNSNDILEVGDGENTSNRKNVFRLTKSGTIYVEEDIKIGSTLDSENPFSLIEKLNTLESEITESQYDLPPATRNTLGGVMAGENVNVDREGVISVDLPEPYELPIASDEVLGGIKIGENLEVEEDGTLNAIVPEPPEPYELPVATDDTLGGIKVQEEKGFTLQNGVLCFTTDKMDRHNAIGTGILRMNGSGIAGTNSISLGESNVTSGESSVGIGAENEVTGTRGIGIGILNEISAIESIAVGKGLKSEYTEQIVLGKYNSNNSNSLLELGNGQDDDHRSNAFSIDTSGNTTITGTLSVNGININAGVIPLISTDYEALSTAEKNKDIIYLITDTNELYYKTNKYGSGEVELSLNDLTNVEITNLSNEQILQYNSTSSKWENVDKDQIPEIEANPQGSPTDTLQTIKINNTVYDLDSVKFLTNEDLDDIFTDGYQVYHADDPSSITNLPTEVDGMFDLVSSGTEDNDEYTQYLYFKDTIYTRNATNDTWSEWAGISGGGGSGNVEDVYVNGTSVLDENNIAQITSYKELTQAQYDALPDSKLTDGILYCITDAEPAASTVIAPVIYSLEEREIGTWIDGKPLYEKTIKTPIPSEAFNKEQYGYNHNIADIDACVYKKGFLFDSNTGTIQSNRVSVNNITSGNSTVDGTLCNTLFGFNRNKLTWTLGDWNGYFDYFVAVVRYTKTIDVPGSGEWTSTGVPAVHYSTDEQVIGTWIDGKPIYQKTWDFFNNPIALTTNDWVDSTIPSSANISSIVKAEIKNAGNLVNMGVEVAKNAGGYYIGLQRYDTSNNVRNVGYITLQYTKSTD